jgi:hypothetical protein
VDPLVVAGGLGELVDLLLGHLDPVADAQGGAGLGGPELVERAEHGRGHRPPITGAVS